MKSNPVLPKVDSTETSNSNDYEIPIGENFKLNAKKKLGSGAFGDIYFGTNIKLSEDVAIKLEPTKAKHPQLFYESKLYLALQGGGKFKVLKFQLEYLIFIGAEVKAITIS